MCCNNGIYKSIMDCNNGILIDNTTCPNNDKSSSLSSDFSSMYFMEEIQNLSMNGARVYFDTCFEVRNSDSDNTRSLDNHN